MDLDANKIVRLRKIPNEFDLVSPEFLACNGCNYSSCSGCGGHCNANGTSSNPFGEPIAPIPVKGKTSSGGLGELSPETIQTGVELVGLTISAIANRKKNETKQEIKAVCGRRPIFRGKKRDVYDNCVKRLNEQKANQYRYNPPAPLSDGMKWALGIASAGALGLLIFGVVKLSKRNVQPVFIN